MKRQPGLLAILATLLALVMALPAGAAPSTAAASSGAEDGGRGPQMAAYMRRVLRRTQDPAKVSELLAKQNARFLAYQSVTISYVRVNNESVPVELTTVTVGPDLVAQQSTQSLLPEGSVDFVDLTAGRKSDFRLRQWLYEWRNRNGTYTEQNVTTGSWSSPEYRWMDNPDDVIDVRWVVGDLAYVRAYPYDGVRFDQQVHGVASFTVDDQVRNWDVFVDFTPTGPDVYGRVTNVFTNYHQIWL